MAANLCQYKLYKAIFQVYVIYTLQWYDVLSLAWTQTL